MPPQQSVQPTENVTRHFNVIYHGTNRHIYTRKAPTALASLALNFQAMPELV